MAEESNFTYHFGQLKTDLQQFINTRYELLRAELKQSASKAAAVAVQLGTAAVLGFAGLILLATCVSIWFATFFGPAFQNQYGLIWGS